MKITVKNFGPIREAKDIEISPMTLFVGPSNTGKSYLAVLIYSIFNALSQENGLTHHRRFSRYSRTIRQEEKHYNDSIKKLSDTLSKEKSISKEAQKMTEELIESAFFIWVGSIKELLINQILYCFGEGGKDILKDDEMSILLSSNNKEFSINIVTPSKSKIKNKIKKTISKDMLKRYVRHVDRWKDEDIHFFQRVFNDICIRYFLSTLWKESYDMSGCYYLPATRGGIMQSHRALVDALIEQAPMAGLTKIRSAPMFNGVLADFMRDLIRLRENERSSKMHPRIRANEKEIISIGRNMEADIMQGEIEVRMTETRYPDFHYKFERNDKPYDLPLMNTSSMVSELAPVSLFVRHYLKKGDFFIVEEPEAHLHPKGQRDIANVLAQLANAGVFTLVTTHSDTILEQVSNSVHASKLDSAKLKALGETLAPLKEDYSAAYSFIKDIKHGTTVKKIPFSPTTGLITKDHLRVSSDLYNQTVNLLEGQDDD